MRTRSRYISRLERQRMACCTFILGEAESKAGHMHDGGRCTAHIAEKPTHRIWIEDTERSVKRLFWDMTARYQQCQ